MRESEQRESTEKRREGKKKMEERERNRAK